MPEMQGNDEKAVFLPRSPEEYRLAGQWAMTIAQRRSRSKKSGVSYSHPRHKKSDPDVRVAGWAYGTKNYTLVDRGDGSFALAVADWGNPDGDIRVNEFLFGDNEQEYGNNAVRGLRQVIRQRVLGRQQEDEPYLRPALEELLPQDRTIPNEPPEIQALNLRDELLTITRL